MYAEGVHILLSVAFVLSVVESQHVPKQKTGTTFDGSSRFTVRDYSCPAPGYCYCGRLWHPFAGLHRLGLFQPWSLLRDLLRSCLQDVRSMVYGSSVAVAGTFIPNPRDLQPCNFVSNPFARTGIPLLHLRGRSASGYNRTETVAGPLRLWHPATEMAVCPKYSILIKPRRISRAGSSSLLLNLPKNSLRSVWLVTAWNGFYLFLAGSGSSDKRVSPFDWTACTLKRRWSAPYLSSCLLSLTWYFKTNH